MKKPLYVYRLLDNCWEFYEWCKANCFLIMHPPGLHVTVMYSREPIVWDAVPYNPNDWVLDSAVLGPIKRTLQLFGDEIVLTFDNSELQRRHAVFRAAGCSWDFPSYIPHVTLTKSSLSSIIDLEKVEPYLGPLLFSGERFEEADPTY